MSQDPQEFITRWQNSGGSERANYQGFFYELCDLLEVPRPDPSSEHSQRNDYVIDRAFTRTDKDGTTSTVYLDLYKRGHFVLETKQGSSGEGDRLGHGKRGTRAWDKSLEKAYHQARDYIRDIPTDHGRPPFLIVCDVGHVIELYAEFSGTGGTYLRYPDPKNHRIYLEELADPAKRELLRKIWTNPHALDPSKHAAKVTRQVADTLATLATSLEGKGHDPQTIATFLQRLLFTLFAEDVGLLPPKSFEDILRKIKDTPAGFAALITQLWKEMATGASFSTVIMQEIAHFNGGLFENPIALPLETPQIELLIQAASQDWKEVEPAIFGTLLERALDPAERHKLGAHYTPRSYVERLIEPTLMTPLREQWTAVKTAAALHHDQENDKKARAEIESFHQHLTSLKILDPACGSANFLYVALARLKELEAEVLDLLEELGGDKTLEMDHFKVRPDQFHGLEINPNACAIAQLVLWIGYFQWHQKTTGTADTNDRPLLPKQQTILNRDAILDYDQRIPRTDPETGKIITIWDGHTTKTSPVTGKQIPDETARKPLFDFTNPRRTTWPEADYIIGNPPFLGASRMRDSLGDGYTEALRKAWKKHKPDSWDFVMFWWHQAAELTRDGKTKAFGFITTNSIHQTFNRRCIEPFLNNDKKPISITFAIPDHPWVDAAHGASVRIAMTVGNPGNKDGNLFEITLEEESFEGDFKISGNNKIGLISPKLGIGANVFQAGELESNADLSSQGMKLHGQGFLVEQSFLVKLGSEYRSNFDKFVRPFWGPKDFLYGWSNRYAMDFDGLNRQQVQELYPECYNHLSTEVKPGRDTNREPYRKENWWLFGRRNTKIRNFIANLDFYIASPRTAKHRTFFRVKSDTICESEVVVIGLSTYDKLAILSSNIHGGWALSQGSLLGPTPRYNNSRCFETFPFPDLPEGELKQKLRDLGEQLDAHRKTQQAAHPDLTLTGIYNVLEKLRKQEPLTDKEKTIHDQGLVTILKQIHDEIDLCTIQAYGMTKVIDRALNGESGGTPQNPTWLYKRLRDSTPIADALAQGNEELEQAILQFLVDLNHQRAAEEAQGKIRYLRPEYQDPDNTQAQQKEAQAELLSENSKLKTPVSKRKLAWPKELQNQVATIQDLLKTQPQDPTTLSQNFGRASKTRQTQIQQILTTLKSLGQI